MQRSPSLGLLGVLLAAACGSSDPAPAPPLPEVTDPLPLIDPRIGTGGFGFANGSAFVGAAVPHGLAKVGPDTVSTGGTLPFHHYSGYWSEDDEVMAFSQTHLHGTGLGDYADIGLLPVLQFDPTQPTAAAHATHFDKTTEVARPGSYAVTLDGPIAVKLAATLHGAHHVYDFGSAAGSVLVDLDKPLYHNLITAAELHLDAAAQTLEGTLHHEGQMSDRYGGYDLYFVIHAKAAWTAAEVWSNGSAPAAGTDANGTGVGAVLHFAAGAPVELQVGLSLVSLAGARANLAAELPAFDQDATIAAAEAEWRYKTGVVAITGGTPAERRIFYTSLYHAFLMPSVISDVDGTWVLAGNPTPRMTQGWMQLSDFSLWDTYRTLHPLYDWLSPDSARCSVHSLYGFAEASGAFPRWPLATGETGVMLGAPAEIVIADAAVKNVPEALDVATSSWPILYAAATDVADPVGGRGGREHVAEYMQYGYVPATTDRAVSITTEYAHGDFALAQLGTLLGHTTEAAMLSERGHTWSSLWDPVTGFLRGKMIDGTWSVPDEDFDPLKIGEPYAEANAWHSVWMVGIHDAATLIADFGSPEALVAKLTTFFAEAKTDLELHGHPSGDIAPRPYYWHGNEPDLNAAFLFTQAGRPDLTADWVRWIMDALYTDGPDGKAGNDDGGTLAAWYVWAALGLYPIAGSDRYIIGAPHFPRARILVDGRELVIEAEGVSAASPYVQSVAIDGQPITGVEINHAQLIGAHTITFVMGKQPGTWGTVP